MTLIAMETLFIPTLTICQTLYLFVTWDFFLFFFKFNVYWSNAHNFDSGSASRHWILRHHTCQHTWNVTQHTVSLWFIIRFGRVTYLGRFGRALPSVSRIWYSAPTSPRSPTSLSSASCNSSCVAHLLWCPILLTIWHAFGERISYVKTPNPCFVGDE